MSVTAPLGFRAAGVAAGLKESGRAGARVGPAGVEHHSPDPAAAHHLAGPDHRGGLHPVGREDGGGGA